MQLFQPEWFGPFELPWLYLAATMVFGLVSAVLASVVPAFLASRQDVVAVLAGRRGDRRPRASTPVVGMVLLGIGIATSTIGAITSDDGSGACWIAASAIISVLGMILVVPVVVSTIARLSGRLPLTARYAARDAARHRTRTVPAVAAVAATVAGVVALGIATASQELADERTYTPQAQMGTGFLTWGSEVLPGEEAPDPGPVWDRIEEVIGATAPDVEVQELLRDRRPRQRRGFTSTYVELPDELASDGVSYFGASIAVADSAADLGIEGDVAELVDSALAEGQVVAFTTSASSVADVTLRREVWRNDGQEPGQPVRRHPRGPAGAVG